jgi:hypothetical protein
MIRRLRAAFGSRTGRGTGSRTGRGTGSGTRTETSRAKADAAVGRGMADVLAALDKVVDDDAALARVYAGPGARASGAATATPGTATATPGTATAAPGAVTAADVRRPAAACVRRPATRGRRPGGSRRRLALGSAAGAAAALAAGAVALTVIAAPGAPRGRTDLTADVVRRVDSALSAAGPGEIEHMTLTTSSDSASGAATVTGTAGEWSYRGQWRSVTYSADGQLVEDEGATSSSVYTLVSYPARTWARHHESGVPVPPAPPSAPGSGGCESVAASLPALFGLGLPGGAAAGPPSAIPARALRTAISCGTLAEVGRQRIDGIETIELISSPASLVAETIWISQDSYLPVRVVVRLAPGSSAPLLIADISWLRPTAQNLATLTVPIPAGFRRVPFAQVNIPKWHTRVFEPAP